MEGLANIAIHRFSMNNKVIRRRVRRTCLLVRRSVLYMLGEPACSGFVTLLSLRVYSASIAETELPSLRVIIFTFKPHPQYMNITAQDLEQ